MALIGLTIEFIALLWVSALLVELPNTPTNISGFFLIDKASRFILENLEYLIIEA